MFAWRQQALGEHPPRIPTLLAVDGDTVHAWTHVAMGLQLARLVGPRKVWRIFNVLAEIGKAGKARPTAYEHSRRHFVKALGGAAVALSVLSGAKLFSPEAAAARASSEAGQSSGLPPFAYQLTRKGELNGRGLATSQARGLLATARGSAHYRGFTAQLPAGFTLDTQAALVSVGENALLIAPLLHNAQDGGGGMAVVVDRKSGAVQGCLGYVVEDDNEHKHVRVFDGTKQMADLMLNLAGIVLNGWVLQPGGARTTLTNRDLTDRGREAQAAFLQTLRNSFATPDTSDVVTAYSGGNFWGCMNSCLSSMGVPSWVIGAIGAVCLAACVGTLGAGCVACGLGVGFGYDAELAACVGWCECEIDYSCP